MSATEFTVYANQQVKGTVTREHGRFWWRRNSGGVEPYPKSSTLEDVRWHIARVCLVATDAIRFEENIR